MPTRRHRVPALLAASAVSLLVLAGCASDTSADSDSSPAEAESTESELMPAAEGNTEYPLELETPWGSTTLEERPLKIAAVTPSQVDAELLASLGVTPYLASEFTTYPWVDNALTTPIVERYTYDGDDKFPAEQIAAAEPDLIIALDTDLTEAYEKLSTIAPVLAAEKSESGYMATDWAASLTRIGEALDLSETAEEVITGTDEFFADFQEEHPDLQGKSASYLVYYGTDGGLQYHSAAGSDVAELFTNMGLADNENAADVAYRAEISGELISKIDADAIIFSDNSDGNSAVVTDEPLFQALGAAQNDHVLLIENFGDTFVIDGEEYEGNLPWALARSGPLSAPWAAEQLAAPLEATLAK